MLSNDIFDKSFVLSNFFVKTSSHNRFLMKFKPYFTSFVFNYRRYKLHFKFLVRRLMRLFKKYIFLRFKRVLYFKKRRLRRYKRLNKRKNLRSKSQLKKIFLNKIKLKVFNFVYSGGTSNSTNNFFKNINDKQMTHLKPEYKKNKNYFNYNYNFLKFPVYTRKLFFMFFIFKTAFFLKSYFLFNDVNNFFKTDPYYVFNLKPLVFFQYNDVNIKNSNIIPNKFFKIKLSKLLVSSRVNFFLKDNITP